MPRGSSPKRNDRGNTSGLAAEQRGESTKRAEEIAAHGEQGTRPVRRGQDGEPHPKMTHVLVLARWATLAQRPWRSGLMSSSIPRPDAATLRAVHQ